MHVVEREQEREKGGLLILNACWEEAGQVQPVALLNDSPIPAPERETNIWPGCHRANRLSRAKHPLKTGGETPHTYTLSKLAIIANDNGAVTLYFRSTKIRSVSYYSLVLKPKRWTIEVCSSCFSPVSFHLQEDANQSPLHAHAVLGEA